MGGFEHNSVLLIEYSEQLRTAYSRHLTEAGFEVIVIDSGVQAIDHVRRQGASVLIINIGLPGMSGGDLIKDAVEADPDLAVIALSVVNDAAIAAHCMRCGAMDFLIKPVELASLEHAVHRALKRRQDLKGNWVAISRVREDLERHIARMEIELKRREDMTLAVLVALVDALENKNPFLGGHSDRVAALSAAIADQLGLSDDETAQVRLAGQLHDLGMVGVKEEVTNKTGPLDQREFEHVRRHVIIGSQVLTALTHLGPVSHYVRSHHERWDGTGYPDGCAGEDIPLGGRILAAAEVFDALCSERPYRRRFTQGDAVEHVRSLGGLNLDPCVSDVLAAVVTDPGMPAPRLDDGERRLGAV